MGATVSLRELVLCLLVTSTICAATAADSLAGSPPGRAAARDMARLYVSPRGNDQASCARAHPCRSISRAVGLARAGDEIDVAPGSYKEQVILTKRLAIRGSHSPVLDASGEGRGVLIKGGAAAGSVVSGLVIEHATYEGILALRTRRVTISDNVVNHDDQGFFAPRFTGECAENGIPSPHVADARAGGCGEAIHLASTSRSRVTGNVVTDDTGGIYLTDEYGPASYNFIAGNLVLANLYDCGITLASHSRRAVSATGRRRPRLGGVYDNTISGNIADLNGVREPGAGILVAAAFPGSAAYGNRIVGNTATRNGLPGVALHSHDVHQDLNDNVVDDNVIGLNAIGGANGGPGDADGGVTHTTGILVWSWATKIVRIHIAGNRISDDYFGIWTEHTPVLSRAANRYRQVRVPLKQRWS